MSERSGMVVCAGGEANSIAADSKGKIVVTGGSYNASGNSDMIIWRYLP